VLFLHNWIEVSEIALKGQCSAIKLPARIAPDNAAAALSALRHEGFAPNDSTRRMIANRKSRDKLAFACLRRFDFWLPPR